MRSRKLMFVAAAVAGTTAGSKNVASANGVGNLQGNWTAVRAERDGRAAADIVGHALLIEDGKFSIQENGVTIFGGTLWLDESTSPAAIDFRHTGYSSAGKTWRGIYRIDGDALTVCDNAGEMGAAARQASAPNRTRASSWWFSNGRRSDVCDEVGHACVVLDAQSYPLHLSVEHHRPCRWRLLQIAIMVKHYIYLSAQQKTSRRAGVRCRRTGQTNRRRPLTQDDRRPEPEDRRGLDTIPPAGQTHIHACDPPTRLACWKAPPCPYNPTPGALHGQFEAEFSFGGERECYEMADSLRTNGPAMDWRLVLIAAAWLAGHEPRDTFHKDLQPFLGYWGSVAAVAGASAALLLGICLLVKWGWRTGLLIGVSFSLMFTTFEEITDALQPKFGALAAIAAAFVPMLCVGMVTWLLLFRLLRLDRLIRDRTKTTP